MKKIWAAVLAGIMLAGLVCTSAFADVMERVQVSNITYYESGYLKSFRMDYTVGGRNLAEAESRVSVQTVKFLNEVGNYPYGDFRDNGRYADTHSYPDWPDEPDNCGFVTWNEGETFLRPESGRSGSLTVSFADRKVDCNVSQTYYLYVWANYGGNTYPDAFVMQFQTGNGGITVGGGASVQDPGNQNQGNQNPGNQDPANQDPVKQSPVNMPRTGDRSALALWMTLGLLAGCGMLVLARRGENNG